MSGDAQAARGTLVALELLTRAQRVAETQGPEAAVRLIEGADLDTQERIVYLRGGMMIGEVPRLDSDEWAGFVENHRDHVARLEAAEQPGAPATGPGSVAWAQAQHTADWLDLNQNPLEHP